MDIIRQHRGYVPLPYHRALPCHPRDLVYRYKRQLSIVARLLLVWVCVPLTGSLNAQQPVERQNQSTSQSSSKLANAVIERVLEYLTFGPPLEAKLRMRTWAAEREIIEVGTYQQAGKGTGRLVMTLETSIAEGKAHWQQISDGRLAWTREEMVGDVQVRRVDIGRLNEVLPPNVSLSDGTESRVPPRLRIGGLAELIDRIQSDYQLDVSEGHAGGVRMLVINGTMRDAVYSTFAAQSGNASSSLVPRHVKIAIPANSISEPLPARIEFWSFAGGTLISILEIYNANTIANPGIEHYRFEVGDQEFVNETDRYMRRFGVTLSGRRSDSILR